MQKIRAFLVGQVREVFSFFTVTECIALLIEACQYKINTSCSSLIIVLLPDFCTAKNKDDSASSSEVSPVIDSTNSRSRTSKFPQGKLTLCCFYFWLTVIWCRQHEGTHHLMCAKHSSLCLEKQEMRLLYLSFTKIVIIIIAFSLPFFRLMTRHLSNKTLKVTLHLGLNQYSMRKKTAMQFHPN